MLCVIWYQDIHLFKMLWLPLYKMSCILSADFFASGAQREAIIPAL